MKKIVPLISFLLLVHVSVFCQDTIVMRNNTKIIAKVLEINVSEIKYKRFDMLDGPLYIELKSNILFIKFANGIKEEFALEDYVYNEQNHTLKAQPVSLKIIDNDDSLYYKGKEIDETDVYNILFASNDKEVVKLTMQAKQANKREFIGFAAMPLAMIGIISAIAGANLKNDELSGFGAGCICFAVPVAAAGIINLHNRTKYRNAAIKLYNQKY